MKVLVVALILCLAGVHSHPSDIPQSMWRAGEVTEPSTDGSLTGDVVDPLSTLLDGATSAVEGLLSSLRSAKVELPGGVSITTPDKLPTIKLPTVKLPTVSDDGKPTVSVNLPSIQDLPHHVAIVAVDPSKLIPGIKGPLPFNPIAIASPFVKPIASLPLNIAGQAYEIPLQGWESFKGIMDSIAHLPKEEIAAGQQAIGDLLDGLSL